MMRIVLIFSIFLLTFNIYCQSSSEYLQNGIEQFQNEDYDSALKNFNKEFKKNKSPEIKFWIASCYFKMENFPEAKLRFLDIIRNETAEHEIEMSLTNLGSCYRSLKNLDSALYYYDKAIAVNSKNDDAYYNKGQLLYYELGEFDLAKQSYNLAIKCDPGNWYYYQKRLEVNFASSNFKEALIDMLKIDSLNPKLQDKFNLAYCYSMLEMYEQADSVFQLIFDDKNALFLNNYGFNKFKLGNPKQAIELINQSLAIKPDNAYAYRNLALIMIDQNNTQKACEYLVKAHDLNYKMNYGDEVEKLLEEYCNK